MTEKETYLYLDLNGKLDVNYFQNNKIFFRMINVGKKPLVQIGNYVFEGRYEDHLGTKVFFVEGGECEPSGNVFERQPPIRLEYLVKTAKVLQLKWRSVPVAAAEESRPGDDCTELRFGEGYAAVLEKFERAELNIKDISARPRDDDDDDKAEEPMEEKSEEKDVAEPQADEDTTAMEVDFELKRYDVAFTRHELFKEFNRLPKKMVEQQKLFETKKEDLVRVVDASNYPVLKQLFLQNVTLDDVDVNANNFQKYVNVQQSISDGIIPDVEMNALTDDIKSRLLHGDNFNNFTLPMKMAYLLVQFEQYKKFVKEDRNKEILNEVDQFGRRPIDKYRLLKQLIKDLWYIIYINKPRNS